MTIYDFGGKSAPGGRGSGGRGIPRAFASCIMELNMAIICDGSPLGGGGGMCIPAAKGTIPGGIGGIPGGMGIPIAPD